MKYENMKLYDPFYIGRRRTKFAIAAAQNQSARCTVYVYMPLGMKTQMGQSGWVGGRWNNDTVEEIIECIQ